MSAWPRTRVITLVLALGLMVAGIVASGPPKVSRTLTPLAAGLDAGSSGSGRSLPGIHRTIRKADHVGVSKTLR